ncbi:S8 family serine peptidase [Evansella cellulosilytica]|uniref:Peptidase S8 and S53 subtilisin kexin sedolisin n=1 Tax=Evansella cellulosilytica (strain ATCC 21833 / DSM 2522 / FERM P-1141 / JCM 9156 / N-4) TaxID=649639 RepID=E6TXB2_EVAC2|nr:S8 family serine peptidase [Evansella cellulosilytica]ADU32307.1 peptidase S8 and S53 subtilisin kexin sedolisin [Evansella cellulosilytica DSM 2522]
MSTRNKIFTLVLLTLILFVPAIENGSVNATKLEAAPVMFPERPAYPDRSDEKSVYIIEALGDPLELVEKIKEEIPSANIRKTFTKLYNGVSLEVKRKDAERLASFLNVNRVDEIAYYEPSLDESVPFIGGNEIRSMLDEEGDKLTGKGVKVGVIDTGIDYEHPDLKNSYYGGYDIVDEDDDPMETKHTEGRPTLHGTHVAGIIAADGRLKGVAPDAEIYAYRTLGPTGMGTTEQVIEAIEKAVEDGVDVINLSLGNTVNGPDWPTSIALDKAVEQGVVAVTSNGNSGPNLWTVGSPGTSSKAISVGASTPPMRVPYLTTSAQDKNEIPIIPMQNSEKWELRRAYPLQYVGLGKKEDYANEDVRGKIVIAKRGEISFTYKARIAESAGAEALIIFNHTDGEFAGLLEEPMGIPVVSISKEAGEDLLKKIEKEEVILRTIYREEEDFMAPFSSRGPVTHTWDIKPDVVAPGVAIDSTIPRGYQDLNGTSMSAPHVAGVAALLKQKYPDWTPEQIKAAIMNTAKPISDKEGEIYPPHVQGTGRIQMNEALNTETLVYPGSLSFGKWLRTDRRVEKKVEITIENLSDKRKKYTIEPPFEVPDGIQWKVPFAIYLSPGETKTVPVTMDVFPSVFEEGIYHDVIEVKSGSETIQVPYLFFVEEPEYPRLMAFVFEQTPEPHKYHYEVYFPGGIDTFGIALYDPDTFQFIDYVDVQSNIDRGMFEQDVKMEVKPGVYKALIFAEKDGHEDTIEKEIYIGSWGEEGN